MTGMSLEQYKTLLDARYRGETVALTADEERRIDKRNQADARIDETDLPRWLLVRPDGSIDGCHSYHRTGWDTETTVWRSFFPRKRTRDQLIAQGWAVRRDDPEHTGLTALVAAVSTARKDHA